ncbi:hypothetical protein HRI_002383200 [Hibiscus trionum]|uniref:Uncharacterized protein n=1 Tax=Hibiscus trionum TaxID=183268 RepID=A0A9W7M432_HIBTR|nr:hypothetical protein HRI_002383200 [Hibiscus trionum]
MLFHMVAICYFRYSSDVSEVSLLSVENLILFYFSISDRRDISVTSSYLYGRNFRKSLRMTGAVSPLFSIVGACRSGFGAF